MIFELEEPVPGPPFEISRSPTPRVPSIKLAWQYCFARSASRFAAKNGNQNSSESICQKTFPPRKRNVATFHYFHQLCGLIATDGNLALPKSGFTHFFFKGESCASKAMRYRAWLEAWR
jgi:hypothetical protein